MRKCTACGCEMENEVIFCEACGTKVPMLHQGLVCERCGQDIPAGQMFCGNCGLKVKIVYPQRTCSKCGHKWTPRKPNPKFCPGCGYNLSRDEVMKVPYVYDEGKSGMLMTKCSDCGTATRHYAFYRPVQEVDTPHTEPRERCYVCIMKEWIEKLKTIDIVEDSFDTSELDIMELDRQLMGESTPEK